MLAEIFAVLGVIFIVIYLATKKKDNKKPEIVHEEPEKLKKNLGELQVFFGSQTGTAAKMASMFAEEAGEHGFNGIVIDLKNISHNEFQVKKD